MSPTTNARPGPSIFPRPHPIFHGVSRRYLTCAQKRSPVHYHMASHDFSPLTSAPSASWPWVCQVLLCLCAPLPVLLSSAAPARPNLSTEHLLVPPKQYCFHKIPSPLLLLSLSASTTLVFSNLGNDRTGPYNCVIGYRGHQVYCGWGLTAFVVKNSFHFSHTVLFL